MIHHSTRKFCISAISAFLFLGLTAPTSVLAQTKTKKATIQEGEEIDTKRSSVREIAGYDETGYYTVRQEKSNLFIEHINKQMTVDKSQQIAKEDAEFYNYCAMMEGNLYLFSIEDDKKAHTSTLSYQKVNKGTLSAEVDPHTLAVAKVASKRDFYGNLFQHSISPDEGSLLYYSANKEKDDDGNDPTDTRFHLSVFDSKMAKKWEKDVKIPLAPNIFSVEQVKVDNNGTVYIIGIQYQEKSEARISRREGTPSYTYHIYRYSNNGADVMEMPIELKGKFITDVQIDGNTNGDIIAAGFYSETGTFSVKGSFYICIDGNTHDIKSSKYTEFDKDFITQYFTEKEKKKEKKKEAKGEEPELADFRMDELLIRQDGGATMIAEQFYSYTVCYTTSDGQGHTYTHCDTYYNYNDILVLTFSPDGSVAWKCKIPKRQTTVNDGGYYSSYSYAAVDDKLYFVFNDNPKNLFPQQPGTKIEPFNATKDLAVVLVEVDAQGKMTKELLMTTEKGDLIIRPKLCLQTGAKEMLILAEKSKMYQFSKVTFK